MFEQNLKKELEKYKGQPIKLSKLYQEVHNGIFTKEEIKNNLKNPEIMKKFMESLNGAIIEETVSTIDMSSYDGKNFRTITIDYGSSTDPMLMVKSSNTVPIETVSLDEKENLTIITIPDLHLDKGCYNFDGTLNKDAFEERLFAFIQFRDGLIEKMKQEGIEIGGLVFTGDIWDMPDKLKGEPTRIATYAADVIESIKKVHLIAKTNEMTELKDDETYFTAFIAGNHDMRLERSVFEGVMEEFSKYIGKDSISLGSGSARIKVGEQFLTFMHHNSLDYGVFINNSMPLRQKRNELSFQFDNYLEMCNSYYSSKEFQDLLKQAGSNISEINFFMTKMNEKLLKENPKLYYFYLPYITPSSSDGNTSRNSDIRNDISFFENFIAIENGRICCNRINKPKVDDYMVFARSPGFITKLDKLAQKIIEKTDNPKEIEETMRYFMLPQIGRNDAYMPVSYMLAHFHAEEIGNNRVHHHDDETTVVAFEEPVTTIKSRPNTSHGNGYDSGWKLEAIAYEQQRPFESIPNNKKGQLMGEKRTVNPYFYEDDTKYDFDPKRDNIVFGVRLYDIKFSSGKISNISARNIQAETILIQKNPYHLVSVMFTDSKSYEQEISPLGR